MKIKFFKRKRPEKTYQQIVTDIEEQQRQIREEVFNKEIAIVIDANIPLYYAGAMHEEKFLENLKGIPFIPWVVLGELVAFAWIAERDARIKERGSIEEVEKLRKHLSELSNKEKTIRESRGEKGSLAYPFVQKKIDQGKWKTIGSDHDLELYLTALSKQVEEKVGESDAKIIACCFLLGERFKDVVLLTRDKGLGKIAREFGITVEAGLGNLTKKSKKKKKNSQI